MYVRLFLKNPSFPLRAPKEFLEGLLKAYLADVAEGSLASQERAIVLSAAAAELLRHHQGLADHAVTLGYVTRLLKLLSSRLETGDRLKLELLFWQIQTSPNTHNLNIIDSLKATMLYQDGTSCPQCILFQSAGTMLEVCFVPGTLTLFKILARQLWLPSADPQARVLQEDLSTNTSFTVKGMPNPLQGSMQRVWTR